MNQFIGIGRLTRDPEMKDAANGRLCKFTIAIDAKKKDGEKEADFIPVVVFGKTAEICERYLAKGKLVAVQGRVKTGSYTNKEGQKVYTTDVIASNVEFLSPKNESAPPAEKSSGFGQQQSFDPAGFGLDESDMPGFM